MTTTGIRNICQLGLQATPSEPTRPLEPGDLVLARSDGKPLSSLIAAFDGWWTHSAIAFDSEMLVDAHSEGISFVSLDEFKRHYPRGLAVARPMLDRSTRLNAAAWAEHATGLVTAYNDRDLGIAFSLLRRAQKQPGVDELMKLAGLDEDEARSTEIPDLSLTCSGFVYEAYANAPPAGAQHPLTIEPAPGIRVEGGYLVVPDREALLDELMNGPEGTLSDRLAGWRRMAQQGMRGVASACVAAHRGEPIPLSQGVTPLDHWTSPTVGERWFLSGRAEAVAATAACGE